MDAADDIIPVKTEAKFATKHVLAKAIEMLSDPDYLDLTLAFV
ncbi:hypothetical protein [Amycolatopsis sp. cmx-11-12]